jgi:hypothetical protein
LHELNYQRGETKSLPRLTRKFSDFAYRRQDFQHILKRISFEIAVFLGFCRNKAISFTFPSIFRNFLQISFRFEFPNNFLQLVQISFKKEISSKMEALIFNCCRSERALSERARQQTKIVQLLKISILLEPQSMLVECHFTNMQRAAI